MANGITIAPGVEAITDGHTLTLQEGDIKIACTEHETFSLLGALRFSLGLNADEFEVADSDEGPTITLDREGQRNLLDTMEAVRAGAEGDHEENWDF